MTDAINYRELLTPKDRKIYVLLRTAQIVNGLPRALYVVLDQETYSVGKDFESLRYWYEEHTCPTNFLRDVALFIDENRPGQFEDDPHGIFEFVGWCTEEEGLKVFDLGTSFNGPIEEPEDAPTTGISGRNRTDFIQTILDRFRVPADDWMLEVGFDPHTAHSDVCGAFLRNLTLKVEQKLKTYTPKDLEKLALYLPLVKPGTTKITFETTALAQMAELIELAGILKIDYHFGTQMRTVLISKPSSTPENKARLADLFAELCGSSTMEVSVGSYGVKFTGTEEQLAQGVALAKSKGFVVEGE